MSLGEVIGQDGAVTLLRRALENDKIAQAYIFHGQEGVGKLVTAVNLAKALNCIGAGEAPCGDCIPCRKIDKWIHPDVALVAPDGAKIRIDQIREIERRLAMSAYEGKKRLYILDPAESLGLEAANAFLKTLEEPPRDTVLILITDKLDSLLPTIRSRCQEIPFFPLTREDVASILTSRTGMEPEKADLIASYARGRLGAALSMDVNGFLEKRDELLDKWRRFTQQDGEGLQDFAALLTASVRSGAKTNIRPLEILLTWIRDLALFNAGADRDSLIHRDLIGGLEDEQARYDRDQLYRIFWELNGTLSLINDTNVNKELAIISMLTEIWNLNRGS